MYILLVMCYILFIGLCTRKYLGINMEMYEYRKNHNNVRMTGVLFYITLLDS